MTEGQLSGCSSCTLRELRAQPLRMNPLALRKGPSDENRCRAHSSDETPFLDNEKRENLLDTGNDDEQQAVEDEADCREAARGTESQKEGAVLAVAISLKLTSRFTVGRDELVRKLGSYAVVNKN